MFSRLLDFIRELRIEYHFYKGCRAITGSREASYHFGRMSTLIRGRSEAQIKRMG